MSEVRLINVCETPGTTANVFIHGYWAAGSSERVDELVHYIRRSRIGGSTYVLHWESGSVREFAIDTARKVALSALVNPAGSQAISAAMMSATALANDYKKYESQAEAVGELLSGFMGRHRRLKGRKINLIGHSLGARVVHYALAQGDWSGTHLGDVILLAGAADCDDGDWGECAKLLDGRIYNVYSPSDGVLRGGAVRVWRRYVGLTPIPGRIRGVRNVRALPISESFAPLRVSEAVLAHTSYWYNLEAELLNAWPAFAQEQSDEHYFQWVVECPATEKNAEVQPDDGEYECPWCGSDIVVRGIYAWHR